MWSRKQWLRAILQGLTVFVTAMMIYEGVPTSMDAFWQPAGQGLIAIATALGINVSTRGV